MHPVAIIFGIATAIALVFLLRSQVARIRIARSSGMSGDFRGLVYFAGPMGWNVAVAGLAVLTLLTLDERGPVLSVRAEHVGYAVLVWAIFTSQIAVLLLLARFAAGWVVLGRASGLESGEASVAGVVGSDGEHGQGEDTT